MRRLLFIGLLLFSLVVSAQDEVDVYIVEGKVDAGGPKIPFFTFNTRDQFDSTNAIFTFPLGIAVTFNVTNLVDFTCGFEVRGWGSIDAIPSNESRSLTLTFDESGTFLVQDPIGDHRALGLGTMLVVSDFDGAEYYGVFNEHEPDWIKAIAEGGSYNRNIYHPDAFTINGFGFPRTKSDARSMIMGNVGDTIRVHMLNAGQMYHFPHWHGYHVTIKDASHHKNYIGWSKDSYGLAPGETMMVELVPDKPGRYPIHNHNLVTTTVGGNYPGGMMMHMHIHE